MTTESLVLRLLSRYGRLHNALPALQSRLDDLGVGVMSRAQIVVDLEDRFGIQTHADEALAWSTGQEVVAFVEQALAHRHRQAS
jgi:acyl carrier protein